MLCIYVYGYVYIYICLKYVSIYNGINRHTHWVISHNWFRKWLDACSMPSHYLNQQWHIISWDPYEQYSVKILLKNKRDLIPANLLKILSTRYRPFCWCPWSAPSHYLNQCWNIVNSNLRNKLQWNPRRNSFIFILENTFENGVCEMASIRSRPQWVNQPPVCWLMSAIILPGWHSQDHFNPLHTELFWIFYHSLTHCGIVMLYGDRYLDQHWLV